MKCPDFASPPCWSPGTIDVHTVRSLADFEDQMVCYTGADGRVRRLAVFKRPEDADLFVSMFRYFAARQQEQAVLRTLKLQQELPK